jgi:hypothetical protein
MGAAFILSIGAALLIFFSGTLRGALALAPARGRLASVAFGGGIASAAGFFVAGTVHLALADSGKRGTPAVAQTLAYLDDNTYLAFGAGIGVMALAGGISIVRTRVVPLWLGIVGIVGGVATFTPLGFFGFLLSALWIVMMSVALAVRPPQVAGTTVD